MSKKSKQKKDSGVKTLSLSAGMMGDLLFVLKPLKEKQLEMMFWSNQLKKIQDDILKSEAIDPARWRCNWQQAFQTGKLVCEKLPSPKPIVKEEADKNGKSKTDSK